MADERCGRRQCLPWCRVAWLRSGAPPPVAPVLPTPTAWSREAGAPAALDSGSLARWWEGFGDPMLTQMLQQIATGRPDVKTARLRLREARAHVVAGRAFVSGPRRRLDGPSSIRSAHPGPPCYWAGRSIPLQGIAPRLRSSK